MAGSTVALQVGGVIKVTSAPGLDQANNAISLSGVAGAATETQAAAGNTTLVLRRRHGHHLVRRRDPRRPDVGHDDVGRREPRSTSKNGAITATTANGQLRLMAKQTGASSAISISNVTGGAAAIGLTTQVAGSDASGTIDGNAFSSASNQVTSAVSGVTINLTSATGPDGVTLTVNPNQVDNTSITTKVQAFVTAYNDVIKTATDEVNEKKIINPQTDDDRLKGAMFGDSRLQSLIDSLRNAFISPVSGLSGAQSIASFAGLSTGAAGSGDVTGQLTLDTTKLAAALAGGLRRDQVAVHEQHRLAQHERAHAARVRSLLERGQERRHDRERDQRDLGSLEGSAGLDRRDDRDPPAARRHAEGAVHRDGDRALEPQGHAGADGLAARNGDEL